MPPGGGIRSRQPSGTPVANGPTDPWGDAQSFTVTYTITPPGGSWTSADNGTYTVELGGSPVSDTDGNTIPTGPVGTFQVETGQIAITKYRPGPQPQDGLLDRDHQAHEHRYLGVQRADLRPVQSPRGRDPGECHRHLQRTAVSRSQRREPGGGRDHQRDTVMFNSNVAPASYSTSYYLVNLGS